MYRIPDSVGLQNYLGDVLAAQEALARQIFCGVLDPIQVVLATRIALGNRKTSVAAFFALLFRNGKGLEAADQTAEIPQVAQPQVAQLRTGDIPSCVCA